jgi:hypothetical protein
VAEESVSSNCFPFPSQHRLGRDHRSGIEVTNLDRVTCRTIAFALIDQMTTSQTRSRTSPIAALVNRSVPLTFTVNR